MSCTFKCDIIDHWYCSHIGVEIMSDQTVSLRVSYRQWCCMNWTRRTSIRYMCNILRGYMTPAMGKEALKATCELHLCSSRCECQPYMIVQVVLTGHSRITKSTVPLMRTLNNTTETRLGYSDLVCTTFVVLVDTWEVLIVFSAGVPGKVAQLV